jgi:hypothetical protein
MTIPKNVTRVTTRKAAFREAKEINKDLRMRGIKRKASVKKISLNRIKPLLRSGFYEKYKKKKYQPYGIFMTNIRKK